VVYFLAFLGSPLAASSLSAASLARLARIPTKRASVRACKYSLAANKYNELPTDHETKKLTLRSVAKALNFFSSLVTSRNSTTAGCSFLMGRTGPLSWVASLHSSREDSPARIFFSLMGNRINLLRYSLRRWMLRWRDSRDLFLRLLSTAMPMVLAKLAPMPAPCKQRFC